MNSYQSSAKDQQRAQAIRSQYISREVNKIEQLSRLDSKVKAPGKAVSSVTGIVGALVMGAGMSQVMVSSNMTRGLALGIPGMIVALVAYPVYTAITNNRKKQYADEIVRLSNSI